MNAANAPAADAAPAAATLGAITARKDVRLAVGVIVALAVIGGTLLILSTDTTEPQALPQIPSDATGQPLLPVPTSAPLPVQDPVSSPRLDHLEERVDALHRSFETITTQLGEVNTRLVALTEQSQALQGQVEAFAARPTSAPAPRRTPKPAAAPTPKMPAIISIDTWGSDPSAAIRDLDGNLAFYREGDAVGLARIQRIDPRTRQVHLRLPDGSTTAVGVQP